MGPILRLILKKTQVGACCFMALLRFCGFLLLLLQGPLWAETPAGEEKKKLSEEEEIAQMMEQLQQFKTSWEKSPEGGEEVTAEEKPAAAPAAKAQKPSTAPTVKITSQPAQPLPRSVQIKTDDGRILTLGLPPPRPGTEKETGAGAAKEKVQDIMLPPQTVKPDARAPVFAKRAVVKEAAKAPAAAAPAVLKSAAPAPSAVPALAKEAVKEAAKAPLPPAVKPAPAAAKQETKEPVKAAPVLVKQEVKTPAVAAKPEVKKEPVKVAPAPVVPIPVKQEVKAPAVPVPAVVKPVVPALPVKAEADEDVVIVQDDAARYQAAKETAAAQKPPVRARAVPPAAPAPVPAAAPAAVAEKKPELVFERDEAKKLGRAQGAVLPADAESAARQMESGQARSKWEVARQQKTLPKAEPTKPNAFAETFYLRPDQRLAYDVYDLDGFIFVKAPNPDLQTQYAIVTGFGGDAMKTRAVPGLQTLDDAKKWVHDNLETAQFESVEIKKLSFGKKGQAGVPVRYWVGQKAFPTLEAAQQEIAMVQSLIESQGGNFAQSVVEAAQYIPAPEAKKPTDIQGPANFEQEEALILKYLDQLDIGEKLFGVLQGEASGEKVTWQSFGETSWRKTNLDSPRYNSQVGFWTNRFVFKGIRFPMNTLDPFLETTISIDTTSSDFSSNVKFFAGLEWRPFARNPWLFNYRPWGGINLLEWIRNYRFYIMYGDRKNLKDPIVGSADSDLIGGVQMFYEWGIELPPLDVPEPKTFSDFVERYIWGEYFGDYRYEKTNFSSEKVYNGVLLNSSLILGVKLPGIPLPENPINEELVLMPYFRFEHINSADFSFPYQNQYFVAAGCRWMPFRNYRYKENEWLSKTKLFVEYVGVGKVQHTKQGDVEPSNSIRKDLRFGVAFSSRRY